MTLDKTNYPALCRHIRILIKTVILAFLFQAVHAQSLTCSGVWGPPIVNVTFGQGNATQDWYWPLSQYAPGVSTSTVFVNNSAMTINGILFADYSGLVKTPAISIKGGNAIDHTDHTGNPYGLMFVINGPASASTTFFAYSMNNLCPNTLMKLSIWVLNFNQPAVLNGACKFGYEYPNMVLRVVDPATNNILGSATTGNVPLDSGWHEYSITFTNGTNSSVRLELVNNTAGSDCGNDFALDDITVRICQPESQLFPQGTTNVEQNAPVTYTANVINNTFNPAEYQWQYSIDSGTTWADEGSPGPLSNHIFSKSTPGIYWIRYKLGGVGATSNPYCVAYSDISKLKVNEQKIIVDSVVVQTKDNVPPIITTQNGNLQLIAQVYPLSVDQSVTWSIIPVTGNASININGLITAQSNGTVWAKAVSVADPTKSDSLLITLSNAQSVDCSTWGLINKPGDGFRAGDIKVPGNQLTVEANIHYLGSFSSTNPDYACIVSKHNNDQDVTYLLRMTRAELTTSNGYFFTPDVCLPTTNTTYHLAMVYDGATLKFYRNGLLMSTQPCSGNIVQNEWITTIGNFASQRFQGVSTRENHTFWGYIDEVRVWNIARTQTQIDQYKFQPLNNPTTQAGLLAYYQFDNLQNKQGNPAFNLSYLNTPTIQNTVPSCVLGTDPCPPLSGCVPTSAIIDTSICPSALPFIWNGINITTAGSHTTTLTNTAGCDSTITLNVILKAISNSLTDTSICLSGFPFIWNSLSIKAAGSYTAHLTNSVGCDSVATLNVTLRATTSSSQDTSICPLGFPFIWNSLSIKAAGSYTAHLTNSVGCDSAATLNVIVPPTSSTTNITIRPTDLPYTWNGLVFNAAGIQTVHLTSSLGCDSTATLILTVFCSVDSVIVRTNGNVPPFISKKSSTLQLVSEVDPLCASQNVIWSITPVTGNASITQSGLVTAIDGGTVWAKAVSVADPTKSDSLLITICPLRFSLKLYPNPAKNILNISVTFPCGVLLFSNVPVVNIYAINGVLVKSFIMKENVISVDISNLSPGTYMVRYNGGGYEAVDKFIKIKY